MIPTVKTNQLKELITKTHVIRLKKGKHYLLILPEDAGLSTAEVANLVQMMGEAGFHSIGVLVKDVDKVKVIEDEA